MFHLLYNFLKTVNLRCQICAEVESFSVKTVFRSASCQLFIISRKLLRTSTDENVSLSVDMIKKDLSVLFKSFSIKGSILSSYRGQTCLLRLKLLSAQHGPKDPWVGEYLQLRNEKESIFLR